VACYLIEHVLEEGQARRKFRSSGSVDIQNDAYLGLQRVTRDRAITRHNYFAYVFSDRNYPGFYRYSR
ncbi:uncharacterized protein METZ01_LOCUS49843, partial [marine metagenome]